MDFVGRRASFRSLVGLLLAVALLVMAACNSDDGSDAGSGETAQSEDGSATETPEEADNDDQANSNGEGQESEEDSTKVEGATAKQQKRIDSGKPTLLIRAPEDGAQVESPVPMRFDMHNGQIVKNSADTDGYVVFVRVGKSSSLIPIYNDQGEIPLSKNGSTRITAMLGGKRGPIKKTAVTITVTVEGAQGDDSGGLGD